MGKIATRIANIARALVPRMKATGISAVPFRGGNWTTLFNTELFPGGWQQDVKISHDGIMANWAVFSCLTLIASDCGKLRLSLVEKVGEIWKGTDSASFSPVLRKPNRFQTRQQFIEQWITSKLQRGNAYILKERDRSQIVRRLYVLDPMRVTPLVAPDGSVYYQLHEDDLSGVPVGLPAVPASEIIHDRMNCLFHPLVGLSPIFASGLAAMQGLNIQKNSAKFFANMSRPGGVLTAPAQISDETAARLKSHWEKNYTGDNMGKVAVLGDGLKYEAMAENAVDSDMVSQLKISAEMVCSTFHVPPFKIGLGQMPAGTKVGDLNLIYYSDCVQALIEAMENLLDEGLGLESPKDGGIQYGTYFELDDLIKMDPETQTKVYTDRVKGAVMTPNEARQRLNLAPTEGGDNCMVQQQNYSLPALAKRDASEDPFGTAKPPAPAPVPAPEPADAEPDDAVKAFTAELIKTFGATHVT